MTREEILSIAKPILFNTEMVRAIQNDRKTATRRACHIKINGNTPVNHKQCYAAEYPETNIDGLCANFYDNERFYKGCAKPPCKVGDYLYVRETWCKYFRLEDDLATPIDGTEQYYYRADGENPTPFNTFLVQRDGYDEYLDHPLWRPSIHMPKAAARVFLRVTDVRVERLQDITKDGAIAEGAETDEYLDYEEWATAVAPPGSRMITLRGYFSELWDSTVKKSDLAIYGWDANPWVWVVSFEKVEVE